MRFALATWAGLPDLTEGDRALRDALRARGAVAAPAIWDAPVDWTEYDAVVIRSCWDYHRRHDEFLAWIDRLEQAGITVINPPSLIRWNSHKRYLAELAAAGIPIVPTISADRGGLADALTGARQRGWRNIVVKPAISASAEGVIPLALDRHELPALDDVAHGDYLVQPDLEVLRTAGEIDVIYFDGEYSHAVRRSHSAGDSPRLVEIEPHVRSAADSVVEALAERPIYCRVDLVIQEQTPLLMEVELIEPELYLTLAPGAARRFATALWSRTKRGAGSET
jgi:glutathione synthase/RimK-type ligase-like ATP-grasp enzyme